MKITNDKPVKELKQRADELGITYNKNATAAQMQELLAGVKDTNETETKEDITEDTPEINPNKVDIKTLLKTMQEQASQIKNLTNLVRETGDSNKIKDFDRQKDTLSKFSYSVKLFPMSDYDCPVINWKTVSNFVDLSEEKIKADQIIEITYLAKDGKELKKEIQLVNFATFLKRSDKIEAKFIKNLDGTDVYVSKEINPETKLEYYKMHPKIETYNVTLIVNGQELTLLSTYLNA